MGRESLMNVKLRFRTQLSLSLKSPTQHPLHILSYLPAPWVPGTQIPQQLPCTLWITICTRRVESRVPLGCPQQPWRPGRAWCTGVVLSVELRPTGWPLGKLFPSGCTQEDPVPGCLQLTVVPQAPEDPRSPQG